MILYICYMSKGAPSMFSKNLRFLRNREEMSQEGLAKALGLNRGNIASYEKGTAEPSMKNLYTIVKYFNTELGDLIESDMEKLRPSATSPSQDVLIRQLQKNREKMISYQSQTDSMKSILHGFKEFHKLKMESNSEITEELKHLSADYERLLELMDTLIQSNKELVSMLSADGLDDI